jgi:hypothetical protein
MFPGMPHFKLQYGINAIKYKKMNLKNKIPLEIMQELHKI